MYEEIVKRYKPRGYKLTYSRKRDIAAAESEKRLSHPGKFRDFSMPTGDLGITDFTKRTIKVCRPVSLYTLHVVLHEFCHVILKHGFDTMHKQEYEADYMAAQLMRLEGLPVTKAIRRGIKIYLAQSIRHDEKKGLAIAAHIRKIVRKGMKEGI